MIPNIDLHKIKTGIASPIEGKRAIRDCLSSDDDMAPLHIYSALRSRTLKLVQKSQSYSTEFQDWFQVLQATSVAISKRHLVISAKIGCLADLIYDHICITEATKESRDAQVDH